MQSPIASRAPVPTSPAVSVAQTIADESDLEHTHRWRVEEQHGAQSTGHCACGAVRDFENGWSGDRSLRLNAGWLTGRNSPRANEAPPAETHPDD